VAGIDPDENTEQRRARENDKGAVNAGENRKAAERAKREVQRQRILAKRGKVHKVSGIHDPSSRAIKPALSLFLRPATKEDMVPLRDTYNRYIDNAFVVPETDRLTESDMLARWQAIKNAKLPFIVACQRGEVIKARNKKLREDMIMPDKVIGFACAADWSDGTCIYRPTVKLEVFVHMEQYMKQVGNCLADKIMSILDPQYTERGGYDVSEELESAGALSGEPLRTISNVLVRYPYEAEKTDKLKWVSKWLKSRFGFEKVADLQGVAEKFDKQQVHH
jgi:L-amino acid N-acyltransferase YncA